METYQKRKAGRPPMSKTQKDGARQRSQRANAARHALAMLPPGTIRYGKAIWSKSTGEKRICRSNGPLDGTTYIFVEANGDGGGPCAAEMMEIVDISPYPPEHYDSHAVSERLEKMYSPDPGKSLLNSPGAVRRALEMANSVKPSARNSRSNGNGADIDANIRATIEARYQARRAKKAAESGQTA